MFMWHHTTWMWLSMLVVWSSLALIIFYAIEFWRRPVPAGLQCHAADVLDERFARGEISAQEYREDRQTLVQTASPLGRGRVARAQRRGVLGDRPPSQAPDAVAGIRRPDGLLAVPRPRASTITDRVIRHRHVAAADDTGLGDAEDGERQHAGRDERDDGAGRDRAEAAEAVFAHDGGVAGQCS
jgi:hypothetical protein